MAEATSESRDKPAVGISEILRWRSRHGVVLFIATALVLGGLATVCAAAAKAVQFATDGVLLTLLFVAATMVVSYVALFVLVVAMFALIAVPGARNESVVRRGQRRIGFRRREDYIFIALWLCLFAPTVWATVILLADGIGIDSATDINGIGYAVVLGLVVMIHACQRFLAESIERSGRA